MTTRTYSILEDGAPVRTYADYRALGGGEAYRRARGVGPDAVVDEIRAAGLRGRGGAGFPTALKWG